MNGKKIKHGFDYHKVSEEWNVEFSVRAEWCKKNWFKEPRNKSKNYFCSFMGDQIEDEAKRNETRHDDVRRSKTRRNDKWRDETTNKLFRRMGRIRPECQKVRSSLIHNSGSPKHTCPIVRQTHVLKITERSLEIIDFAAIPSFLESVTWVPVNVERKLWKIIIFLFFIRFLAKRYIRSWLIIVSLQMHFLDAIKKCCLNIFTRCSLSFYHCFTIFQKKSQ